MSLSYSGSRGKVVFLFWASEICEYLPSWANGSMTLIYKQRHSKEVVSSRVGPSRQVAFYTTGISSLCAVTAGQIQIILKFDLVITTGIHNIW